MLKAPRAPVSGFTPQVRRATPGTAQQVAKDTANNGLKKKQITQSDSFQYKLIMLLGSRADEGSTTYKVNCETVPL